MSVDGLNAGQINKFVARFKMKNPKLEGSYWVANDGDYLYTITAEKYWAALNEGDLS